MNNSIYYPLKPIINTIKRLNLVIFIVVIVCGLIFSIFTLTNILQQTTSDNSQPSNNNSIIDLKTANSLNKLKTSSENSGYQTLPAGKINPFSG